MKKMWFVAVWAACVAVDAWAVPVRGVVFRDRNGNGIRDRGEKALAHIPVSDGDTVVLTDGKGRFSLDIGPGTSVFPILPAGYAFAERGIANASFRYFGPGEEIGREELSFALVETPRRERFRIAAVGDVQVKNRDEASYADRTVLTELAGRGDIDFSVFLGDQVNDDCDLMRSFVGDLAALPHPVWTVVGNHDRDMDSVRLDRVYCSLLGAGTYAFDYGKVHFIVLNNVFTEGRKGYSGRVTERQLRFVRNRLRLVPEKDLVVLCQHIPLAYTRNRDEVEQALGGRRVLVLSGHTHTVGRHCLSEKIHELVAGASCGTWWVGERDQNAIPLAMQQCGSPRNYFVVDFDGADYAFRYKGIGLDADRQMEVWIGGEERIDGEIPKLAAIPAGTVVANVFGGCDSTRVMMRVDDGEWIEMERTPMTAPNVSRVAYWNRHGGYPTKFSLRMPLRQSESPHIWVAELPVQAMTGTHRLTFTARDPYGFDVSGVRVFTLSR